MDLSRSAEETIEVIDDLVEQYEMAQESDDISFMGEQDAHMKVTALKSIKGDVEQYGL